MTSDAVRAGRTTARFVYGTWAFMTLAALVFVLRYPQPGPIIDEWEFVPALTGHEPFGQWLWTLHNEHRFPLPRAIYFGLFQLTHDFRTGCFVSVIGISLLALGMIRAARRLRGRLHYADAFFPISLLHWGHVENYLMGYQLCFMLIPVLAGALLVVMLRTDRINLFRNGLAAGGIALLLMLCGAGGLAFGPPTAVWLLAGSVWLVRSRQPRSPGKALCLAVLAALIVAYIPIYFHGYARPDHHPPSAGLWPSAIVALQALSMAFGPATLGLWPESAALRPAALVLVIALALAVMVPAVGALLNVIGRSREDRPRALGLLLFLGAVGAMAFGIGWGRSGFIGEDGTCRMGLAIRYSWIVWPALAGVYLLGVWLNDRRSVRWLPVALFATAVFALPFNMETGRRSGEKHLENTAIWEADVRAGLTPEELVDRHHPNWPEYLRERLRVGVRLLREHGIGYYRKVDEHPR